MKEKCLLSYTYLIYKCLVLNLVNEIDDDEHYTVRMHKIIAESEGNMIYIPVTYRIQT